MKSVIERLKEVLLEEKVKMVYTSQINYKNKEPTIRAAEKEG